MNDENSAGFHSFVYTGKTRAIPAGLDGAPTSMWNSRSLAPVTSDFQKNVPKAKIFYRRNPNF
jgi:hypothetical protein